MSTNNQEEHQSFWKRTLIGIPFWLLALVLLILIVYWSYKQEYFAPMGFNSPRGNVAFAQNDLLAVPTITPVDTRLGLKSL